MNIQSSYISEIALLSQTITSLRDRLNTKSADLKRMRLKESYHKKHRKRDAIKN